MRNQELLQKAIDSLRKGRLAEAQKTFLEILTHHPKDYDALLNLGLTFAHAGNFLEAKQYFLKASSANPKEAEPHYNLGIIYSIENNLLGSIDQYQQAIKLNPQHIESLTNLSDLFNQLERYQEALEAANQAAKLNSPHPETWLNLGKAYGGLQDNAKALKAYQTVLEIQPLHKEGLFCLAYTLDELQNFEEALKYYDVYLSQYPKNPSALTNKGSTLNNLNRYREAFEVLEESIKLNPIIPMSWLNAGTALHNLKQFDKALAHYDQALALQVENAMAWSNKGNTLSEMGRYQEALICFDRAIAISPDHAIALNSKGNALVEMKRYEDALIAYQTLLTKHPEETGVRAQIMHLKMRLSDWSNYEAHFQSLYEACVSNGDTCSPFISLGIFNDSAIQKKIAHQWAIKASTSHALRNPLKDRKSGQKIRIGYYSPDFKNHPVSFLIAELIEVHDRNRFEVFAFSFSKDNSNPMQSRLSSAFDQFVNVQAKSDIEIAALSREMGIDIAIDLCGFTHENRFGIFHHRAAPIQVSYLGHPGTMGADCIDYIIADRILIPLDKSADYSEKLIHLPYSFQINDRKREIASQVLNKADFGLPKAAIVYCCFNNNFKITPDIFSCWMEILKDVAHSVLWLLEDTPAVTTNLRKEAHKAGIDPDRIIFAKRIAPALYLARYQLADIFLDTCPFNGGATASDALWAGLPIITKLGEAYSGRMAASLLHAIGLPELVTKTNEEYIDLAKSLGLNAAKLAEIKAKLANNRLSAPLFNTPLNALHIETAFVKMMERHLLGQAPDHIEITP